MPRIEIAVVTADGHASELHVHRPGDADVGLLWLPALGVPAKKYDTFAGQLADLGVACAVHEWRGHGSSCLRAKRGSDWGYRDLLQHDLPASLAALPSGVRWSIGGHSLGGQLAAMAAARQPEAIAGLVLVATGVPHYLAFAGRQRLGIGLFSVALPVITALAGYYPGDRLGFAGREAGQLMRDWATTVRTGRYLHYGDGTARDDELAAFDKPVLGVRFADDWLVPQASLDALLAKLGDGRQHTELFDEAGLGTTADHFRWMRQPTAVAEAIAAWIRAIP